MKKNIVLASFFMAASFVSCSSDEEIFNAAPTTLSATIEDTSVSSRVGFTPATDSIPGSFFWSAKDTIGIISADITNAKSFTKSSFIVQRVDDTNKAKAYFTGTLPQNEEPQFALYPYNQKHSHAYNKNKHSYYFYLPDVYTYTGIERDFPKKPNINKLSFNMPMFGKLNTASNVTFTHMGGVLCFKVDSIPAAATQFKCTVSNKNIHGKFVYYKDNATPVITATDTTATKKDNTVIINFPQAEVGKPYTSAIFYVPVPITGKDKQGNLLSYESLTLDLTDGTNSVLANPLTKQVNLKVKRGHLVPIKVTLPAAK